MVDLFEVSGLPLKFDEEHCQIHTSPEVRFESEKLVTLKEIIPILLNKSLRYPEKVYRQYHNLTNGKPSNPNVSYDVVVLPIGLLGIEFIKTHIFYSDAKDGYYDSMIEVLSGNLTVLIQKNREKLDPLQFETYVDEVGIFTLRKGERLSIPTGYFYTFFNTGVTPVVFAKVAAINHDKTNYEMFRREKGLAYYLISKNAKVEIVANPKYKIDCKVKFYNTKKTKSEEKTNTMQGYLLQKPEPIYEFIYQDEFINSSIYASALS